MRRFFSIALILVALLLCTGAACEQAVDPNTEAEVEAICESIVESLSEGDYEAVAALARADVVEMITPAALEEALGAQMEEAGPLKRFRDTGAAYTTNQETGERYILVATIAKFQSAKYTFSVYLDPEDYSLVGIYMK